MILLLKERPPAFAFAVGIEQPERLRKPLLKTTAE